MKGGFALLLLIILASCAPAINTIELPTKIIEVPLNATQQEIRDPCVNTTIGNPRDTCYFNLAQSTNDSSFCKNTGLPVIYRCYQTIAVTVKNQNICVNIHQDYERDLCYKAVAEIKQDGIICGSIIFKDIRLDCYENTKAGDPTKCDTLQTAELRTQCRDFLNK